MKYTQGKYLVLSKKTLAKEIYDITILCPDVAEAAVAGQFVNVKVDGFMLRRLSVENNVSLFSALDTVRVLLDVLEETTFAISTIDKE